MWASRQPLHERLHYRPGVWRCSRRSVLYPQSRAEGYKQMCDAIIAVQTSSVYMSLYEMFRQVDINEE
jgi:hypothetical protein